MTTDNDYDRYRISGRGNSATFYRNTGASKRYGLDAAISYMPVNELEIKAAYTYSHFKYNVSTPTRIMMDDTTLLSISRTATGCRLPATSA